MKKMSIALLAILLSASLLAQGSKPAQPAAPPRDSAQPAATTGTGGIRGRVLAAGTTTPLRRVQISLRLADGPGVNRTVNTDAQGRYEFTGLPAGRFALSAAKPGYVGLQYGQRRAYEPGTPVVLTAGQALTSIDFALPRGSVIAGRITDEFNEAMTQVQVQVQRFDYSADGQRRLLTAGNDQTDDRGEFRVYGLMPGEYVVTGTSRAGIDTTSPSGAIESIEGYPPTFYPGTPNEHQAQPITLGIGEEVSIQFGMTAARLARINGTVRDSEGRITTGQVFLVPRNSASTSRTTTGIGVDGSFNLRGVPAGDYTLEVRRPLKMADGPALVPAGARPESASVPISVAGTDIVGLSITTSTGSIVSGRVVWEGKTPTPNTAPFQIRVNAAQVDLSAVPAMIGPSPSNGLVDENGNFRLDGVFGRVFLGVGVPVAQTGWMLKSVMLDGRDITNIPLDAAGNVEGVRITMTDKVTNIAGRVTDSRGTAVLQYVVVVQPADEMEPASAMRYVRVVRPDTNGRFEFRNLRPGRYLATAIESMEQGRQGSPEFRRQLQRGAHAFSLKEGETLSLDLRLTEGL